jgi:DNA polymerase
MKLITLDFETYYDKEYSLRKMTPAQYILDERYETICCATQIDAGPVQNVDGPKFRDWLSQHDPADCISLTFNALFDNCILAWRFGWVPSRMVDGLGMARALLGHKLRRLSLESVAKHLELGDKGDTIRSVIGMRRADIIAAGLFPSFCEYAAQDVRLLKGVFNKLAPSFPKAEYRVMDLVLRCAVEPRLTMNIPKLTAHLENVCAAKEALLRGASVEKPQLMSATQFAALLVAEGVEIETKVSNTGNTIPALAKSDQFMVDLLEHENPRVQSLAAARIGLKSTLEESRTERLLAIAGLSWPT